VGGASHLNGIGGSQKTSPRLAIASPKRMTDEEKRVQAGIDAGSSVCSSR
jgi:hypothetical protein